MVRRHAGVGGSQQGAPGDSATDTGHEADTGQQYLLPTRTLQVSTRMTERGQ